MFNLIALITGVLFGMGMVLSGMVEPQKVISFLDIAGEWDMSLAFVMGGALIVFLPCYQLIIKPRQHPLQADEFSLSNKTHIDRRLITGASLFGIGWGLAGICPGPAIASLSGLNGGLIVFLLAMVLGFVTVNMISKRIS